jgi:hypothetical protein
MRIFWASASRVAMKTFDNRLTEETKDCLAAFEKTRLY